MGTRRKVGALALAIAALAAWFAWSAREGPALVSAELEPADTNAAGPKPTEAVQAAPDASTRSAIAEETPADPDAPVVVDPLLAHPFLYVLVVRTLDEWGLPSTSPLSLAPAGSDWNAAAVIAQQGACRTVIWRGKQPEMDVDVRCGNDAGRRFRVRAGAPAEIALLGESAVGTDGASASLQISFVLGTELSSGSVTLHPMADAGLSMQRFPHPHARFAARFVDFERAPESAAEFQGSPIFHLTERVLLSGIQVDFGDQLLIDAVSRRGILLPEQAAQPASARITVLVLDEHGEPAPNVLVGIGRDVDGSERTGTTDAQGAVDLGESPSGWWELRAGGGPGGMARERRFVEAPDTLHWVARLERGARLFGRVVHPRGEPFAHAHVRYESLPAALARATPIALVSETSSGEVLSESGDALAIPGGELRAPWVDQVRCDESGRFELANLPPGLGRISVLDADRPDLSARLVEEGILPGEQELVLRVPSDLGALHLAPSAPEGAHAAILARAVSEATGRISPFLRDEAGGVTCPGLLTGWYRVEVGAGSLGWHDLGRHFVGPGARVELGAIVLPPPARVRVIAPEQGESHALDLTFYLRRPDLDVRGEPRPLAGKEVVLLPAGLYWAFWTASDGKLRHQGLKLAPGAEAELDLR